LNIYIFVLSMWKLTLGSSSHLMTGKISVSRTGTIQYFWWYGTCSCRSPYTLVFHKSLKWQVFCHLVLPKVDEIKKLGWIQYIVKKERVNWFSHLNLLWKDFHPHFWICLTLVASITTHNINTTTATLITKSQLPYPWNP
jgi:hypothetical protein